MHSHAAYDPVIVGLSILIAVLTSYTSLDLAARMRVSSGWHRRAWLMAAALVMGGGIWAMHFVGMLAFSVPGVEMAYDPTLTTVSLLVPVAVTAASFVTVGLSQHFARAVALAGTVMGLGIASMHYIGMAAMRIPATVSYDAAWVAVSLVIAVSASVAALWLALGHTGLRQRVLAALAMGMAVSGMHYAAMRGAGFDPIATVGPRAGFAVVNQGLLALLVAGTVLVILGIASAAALIDRSMAQRLAHEAEALRESEERFRLLVQSVTDYAIFLLDPAGIVRNWNAGAERIKGYAAHEIVGRHFSTFYTPEDQAIGLPATALESARQQGRFEHEGWRLRKDGSRFWASVILDPVRNDRGELVGFAKVTRDITERKQTQEALDATRESLFQARKLEAIGQLTGGVSHEFNNLLMAILASLELARKRVQDNPSRALRFIDNAVLAAQRGATLTQRMLAFARRQHLEPEVVSLDDVMSGMSELLEHSLGTSHRLSVAVAHDLPPVMVDKNQLELALLNLVLNARDAMPRGGQIKLSGKVGPEGGEFNGLAGLAVTDTGTGMDEDTLAKAREPFFTTKGTGKGTGLGLAMVSGLAEQSRGHLVLKSELGRGTTAELWLPIAQEKARSARAASQPGLQASHGGRKLKLLVVDDDPLVLENTAAMVEDLGHEVKQASSGREALSVVSKLDILDAVITDQVMPGMTGAELAQHLEALRPGLPIVIASGYSESPDTLRYPRLNKPYDQSALARLLENISGKALTE